MSSAVKIYNLLCEGYMPREIKEKLLINQRDYDRITQMVEFTQLLYSCKNIPATLKIKEIEDNLFGLLQVKNRTLDQDKRIEVLTSRYASFLIQ